MAFGRWCGARWCRGYGLRLLPRSLRRARRRIRRRRAQQESDGRCDGWAVQFTAYKSSDGACVQATSGGKVVYNHSVDSFETFTLGQPADAQDNIAAIANGTDVTGRGRPDMIVSLFTGGAHCCTIHYVFELEPQFKLLATLNDSDDDLAHFARSGADPRYYYITADWTFGYWPTCFACSPSELVTLQWVDDDKGGGFHLAMDKMQKPAPTPAEWNKKLSAAQAVVARAMPIPSERRCGRRCWI